MRIQYISDAAGRGRGGREADCKRETAKLKEKRGLQNAADPRGGQRSGADPAVGPAIPSPLPPAVWVRTEG